MKPMIICFKTKPKVLFIFLREDTWCMHILKKFCHTPGSVHTVLMGKFFVMSMSNLQDDVIYDLHLYLSLQKIFWWENWHIFCMAWILHHNVSMGLCLWSGCISVWNCHSSRPYPRVSVCIQEPHLVHNYNYVLWI